jgi:hypothetical protein
MKNMLMAVVGSFAAVAVLGAQDPQTRPQTPPAPPAAVQPAPATEVTLKGCLVQGSGPTVFLLQNAKLSTAPASDKGKTYILARAAEDLDFVKELNHEVTINGAPEVKIAPAPPAGQMVAEKDLPKLSAKSLTMIADKCSAAQ